MGEQQEVGRYEGPHSHASKAACGAAPPWTDQRQQTRYFRPPSVTGQGAGGGPLSWLVRCWERGGENERWTPGAVHLVVVGGGMWLIIHRALFVEDTGSLRRKLLFVA